MHPNSEFQCPKCLYALCLSSILLRIRLIPRLSLLHLIQLVSSIKDSISISHQSLSPISFPFCRNDKVNLRSILLGLNTSIMLIQLSPHRIRNTLCLRRLRDRVDCDQSSYSSECYQTHVSGQSHDSLTVDIM